MYGRPKAPAHGRRKAAPAKREIDRSQRVRERAARAIKSAELAKLRKSASSTTPTPRYAVDQAELAPIPKVRRLQNKRLRELASGMPCLLRAPGVRVHDPATTVACHSNWRELGGKGAHRKADDSYSVWGCFACHTWLDSGNTGDADAKKRVFRTAHVDQRRQWELIAQDAIRSEVDRKAARWALNQLAAGNVERPMKR